ncbi:hypothetical protein [Streptomyces sp. NRRL F-5123]|nr:hypothetical protein [Streptomyces sp. NRRL F-5123]
MLRPADAGAARRDRDHNAALPTVHRLSGVLPERGMLLTEGSLSP